MNYTIKSEAFRYKSALHIWKTCSLQVSVVVVAKNLNKHYLFYISEPTNVTYLYSFKSKQTASQLNYNLLPQATDF